MKPKKTYFDSIDEARKFAAALKIMGWHITLEHNARAGKWQVKQAPMLVKVGNELRPLVDELA